MDLTWGAILKVIVAGLGTYVFMPLFMAARDFVLWKIINKYILNGALELKVRRYVELKNKWNAEFIGNSRASTNDGNTIYEINGKQVEASDWAAHLEESKRISRELGELTVHIDRKAWFLKLLITHYKQQAVDPINDWKKYEEERLSINHSNQS